MRLVADWWLNDGQRVTRASIEISPLLIPVSPPFRGRFSPLSEFDKVQKRRISPSWVLIRMYNSPWKMYASSPGAGLRSTAPTLSETAMQ